MSKVKTFGFDTLTLHAGQRPDPSTGARATPIYQTASYVFKSADHAASLYNVERAGHGQGAGARAAEGRVCLRAEDDGCVLLLDPH